MNRAPNFDHLAHIYRWLETASFGGNLWRCRCHFLSEFGDCHSALVLGDGDGRFTARLLETNAEIVVDAVDASSAMLRALRHRAGVHSGRVRTICADLRSWEPAGQSYDLVVSHFFLDCLTTEEVGALARRLRSSISPRTRWVISEFSVPPNGFGRVIAQPVVSGLYAAFGLLTGLQTRRLPDYAQAIQEQGFRCDRRQTFLRGMLVCELWSGVIDELLQPC